MHIQLETSDLRKAVCLPVGPLFYEVGADGGLAADTFRAKQLHDDYTESPEYMALLRGALSMMKLSHIDLLDPVPEGDQADQSAAHPGL